MTHLADLAWSILPLTLTLPARGQLAPTPAGARSGRRGSAVRYQGAPAGRVGQTTGGHRVRAQLAAAGPPAEISAVMRPTGGTLRALLVLCAAAAGRAGVAEVAAVAGVEDVPVEAAWSVESVGRALSDEAEKSARAAEEADGALGSVWPVCPYNASVTLEQLLDQVSWA